MGHLRIGRLPKILNSQQVGDLLDRPPGDTTTVTGATVAAAEGCLRALANGRSLTYCPWLLTRLT